MLALIANTFTEVRLWWTKTTDFCSNLTNQTTVSSSYRNSNLFINFNFNSFRNIENDRVTETQREFQFFACNAGSITDSVKLKNSCKALSNTSNGILYQRTIHSVH